jgi:hypothetical protein
MFNKGGRDILAEGEDSAGVGEGEFSIIGEFRDFWGVFFSRQKKMPAKMANAKIGMINNINLLFI